MSYQQRLETACSGCGAESVAEPHEASASAVDLVAEA